MPPERPRILVVEDSPTMMRFYRMVLEDGGGFSLLFAHDGVEGLDLAAQEEPTLYVVDINMPRIDGLEFLRRLRGELGRTAPALVISTEGDASDRRDAREAGADRFLAKPLAPADLLGAVRELVEDR